MVQREIYRLVTREQAEAAAAQLMDINSKILVNRILIVLWGSQRSLKQWISSYAHADCKSAPVCSGEVLPREDSRLFQQLPGLSTSHALVGGRLRNWGERAQQSTCHLFIPLCINNSSLRIMRLNSNAFLCSCHEGKPRWRSPDKPKSLRNWEKKTKKKRSLPGAGQNGLFIKL